MKRKIVALFMVTVMALTAMTVAVTAKPANAASTQAPVGSTNVQAPALVGQPVGVGTPAMFYLPGGITEFFFVRGTDGALWVTHWGGMFWSSPTSLSGRLTSDPAAAAITASSVFVAARGTDGALWVYYYNITSSVYNGWQRLGGQLLAGTGPSAERYDYGWFMTGTNHALYAYNICGGQWQNLGGYLTSSPAAASPTTSPFSGVVKVFARGTDGALWTKEWIPSGYCFSPWSAWQNLGGQLAPGTGPAACSYGVRFDVFVQGTNGALWHKWYNGGTWSGWESLGGKLTSSPAAANIPMQTGSLGIDVLVRGTDGALWERYYNGGWSGWEQSGSGM